MISYLFPLPPVTENYLAFKFSNFQKHFNRMADIV